MDSLLTIVKKETRYSSAHSWTLRERLLIATPALVAPLSITNGMELGVPLQVVASTRDRARSFHPSHFQMRATWRTERYAATVQ
jgi:hypothetical protein